MHKANGRLSFTELRKAIVLLLSLCALMLCPVVVDAKTVSDPNHKGWSSKHPRSKQVAWKPVVTKCIKCEKITAQYNNTVQELLNHRYWVNFWGSVRKNREQGKKDPFWPGKGDITEFEGKAVAANLELMELQNAQLAVHRKMVLALEQQAQYLAQVMNECERTACLESKPSKLKKTKIAGERTKGYYQPDIASILKQYNIDWKGPYHTDCLPCQPNVAQLNALPGWVVRAHMQLQRAEAQQQIAEQIKKSNQVQLTHFQYSHPDKNDYSGLPAQIAKLKSEIAALSKLFTTLLTQLAQCEAKFCSSMKSEDASYLPGAALIDTCPEPPAHEAITVGANVEVGSKANFREKAKRKAKGLATKAITGLLGISGGSKAPAPVSYKDPVKKKYKTRIRNKREKRDISLGGLFTSDGLLISTNIKKAPGKGTFQTVYLVNQNGWKLMPIRLFMYEIWANWKLSVSWTRDTFVDGELVKHEQGGWSESWRELIARGKETEYAEVPIWEQLGFNTAVSGARSLGTLFPVSPAMLASQPINLVVHVTDPKKDPVVTQPYVFNLSLDKKGRVVVEEVEQTTASSGAACDETATSFPISNDATVGVDPTSPYPSSEMPPNGSPSNASSPETVEAEADIDAIEEINVTGNRLRNRNSTQGDSSLDGVNTADQSTAENRDASTDQAAATAVEAFPEYGTGYNYGGKGSMGGYIDTGLKYQLEMPMDYVEEIEEPTKVGIVLKKFYRRWIPAYKNHTAVTAKLYVPDPANAKKWVPHDSVSRKITVSFIARSNELGMALNAKLKKGPQDAPDLYFDPSSNPGTECRDDPTGSGHFGTCTTTSAHNEYRFAINNEDYGSFSRLDVSCDDCVSLTPVAGLFPSGFVENQRWEVAVEEPDREKRAVYVPTDSNRNQIADGYLPDRTSSPRASDDSDNAPIGNGVKGDGFSAYEEYRGFIRLYGSHKRTDWGKKTIMIDNLHQLSTSPFATASGLEVVEIEMHGHKNRIINFNSGHANLVNQHGLILRNSVSLGKNVLGRCTCERDRPKNSQLVAVKTGEGSDIVAHELGHAVGMWHHGEVPMPQTKEAIRAMTGGIGDLFPGRVHSGPTLCGKTLPSSFYIGTKGDQGSGHESCYMRYDQSFFVYEQEGKDYDCMSYTTPSLFDDSPAGTGPNGFHRTADDAVVGNCLSQIWISSQ